MAVKYRKKNGVVGEVYDEKARERGEIGGRLNALSRAVQLVPPMRRRGRVGRVNPLERVLTSFVETNQAISVLEAS